MKTILTLIVTACLASISQGEADGIKIIPVIKEGDNITNHPTAILIPGKKTCISKNNSTFSHGSQLGPFPLGVIINAVASFKGEKISYSVLVTIREHRSTTGGSNRDKAATFFETRELILSGVTKADEKVEATIGEGTKVIISFQAAKIELETEQAGADQPATAPDSKAK